MSKIIVYGFDGTLTPYPLPKYKILENCGYKDELMSKEIKILVKEKCKKTVEIYIIH